MRRADAGYVSDMSQETIRVVPHGDGWTYRTTDGEPQGEFASAAEAENAAKEEARKHGDLDVVVEDREGHVTDAELLDEATEQGLG